MHGEKWNIIEMSYESNLNVGYDFVYTKMSWEAVWRSRWMVQMWREVVKRYKNKNAPPICPRQFGTSAEVSVDGHFGPFIKCWDGSALVLKCLKDNSAPTEKSKTLSWVRSVLGPKCPYTVVE